MLYCPKGHGGSRSALVCAHCGAALEPPTLCALPLAQGITLSLVYVPAGLFMMGSPEEDGDAWVDETPQCSLSLKEYWIGRYPVTVAQWRAFAQATGYQTAAEVDGFAHVWTGNHWDKIPGASWQHPVGPDSAVADDHPVTQANWDDAMAFCAWASAATGARMRLPTEAEWEKAARGTIGLKYPWGDAPPDANRCNYNLNEERTTPVERYSPQGDSPYGCADMVGNVCEWTSTLYRNYPYDAGDGREDPTLRERRTPRGGCFVNVAGFVRAAIRFRNEPVNRFDYLGFRVCTDVAPQR